jgi:hypothetical protein
MRIVCTVFVFASAFALFCRGQVTYSFLPPSGGPLRVIADAHAGTNEFLQALRVLHDSKITNEPPEFWTAIANNANYDVDRRRRAVLQLFARHFKPGMTLHQIGLMLNHPTWLKRSECGWFASGVPPAGGDPDDQWAWFDVPGDDNEAGVIWFRFKTQEQVRDIYNYLECGADHLFDDVKVIGVVSEECFSNHGHKWNLRIRNRFGLTDGSDASDIYSPGGAQPPEPPRPGSQLR